MIIRKAITDDLPQVFSLVKELAFYEKAPEQVTVKLEEYKQAFPKYFDCIVAESENKILGMALYFWAWSTWKGKMLFLEDFVISPVHRRLGIGQKIFDRIIQIAKEENCALIKWQVLDWNQPALEFYRKNNAIIEKEWWNGKIIF